MPAARRTRERNTGSPSYVATTWCALGLGINSNFIEEQRGSLIHQEFEGHSLRLINEIIRHDFLPVNIYAVDVENNRLPMPTIR